MAPPPIQALLKKQKQEHGDQAQPSPEEQQQAQQQAQQQQIQQAAVQLELENKHLANEKLKAEIGKIKARRRAAWRRSGHGHQGAGRTAAHGARCPQGRNEFQTMQRKAAIDLKIAQAVSLKPQAGGSGHQEGRAFRSIPHRPSWACSAIRPGMEQDAQRHAQDLTQGAQSHTAGLVQGFEKHSAGMEQGAESHAAKVDGMRQGRSDEGQAGGSAERIAGRVRVW
jgi:hypothetical protein